MSPRPYVPTSLSPHVPKSPRPRSSFPSNLAQFASLAFVRRTERRRRRMEDPLLPAQLEFFGGRCRRQIVVQGARLGTCDVTDREREHLQDLLAAKRTRDLQFVANL